MPGMSCIAGDVGSPLVINQRFIKFISSDCDLLMRVPSERSCLFSVCDSIKAVISTACAWCVIMCCINCTSAGEYGGNVARVEGGRVRVGWPGAPGWTTTGVAGSLCCAEKTTRQTQRTQRLHREEIKLGHHLWVHIITKQPVS
jgi:hypothetical protein